jgi:hypothetical protein
MYYTRNDSYTNCDVPPLSKDRDGAITEVMTYNISHTRIKHSKCSKC